MNRYPGAGAYLMYTCPSWHTPTLVLKLVVVVGEQAVHPLNYWLPVLYLAHLFLIPLPQFNKLSQ